MPPEPVEHQGHAVIAEFFQTRFRNWRGTGMAQLVPARANNQPAFGYYLAEPPAASRQAPDQRDQHRAVGLVQP